MLEREAMAILVSAQGVNYAAREAALAAAGSAQNVLADPFAFSPQLGADGAKAVARAVKRREDILERIAGAGVHLVVRGEAGYPGRLAQIPHAPHLLFVQGAAELDDAMAVAIVGTRSASAYGLRHTRRMAQELAQSGVCIVSGLALGIDAAAHEGALLARGRTVAVLGGALDKFYPAENRELRDRILDGGGSVISEYPMGMPPGRYTFLHRNRIIAGMAMGVLVTDGPVRSGALKTATDAGDYGREVFALPGDVDAPNTALAHKLIAEGAHLAVCGADILAVIAPQLQQEIRVLRSGRQREAQSAQSARNEAPAANEPAAQPAPIPADLTSEERAVLSALDGGEMEFDALCEALKMDGAQLGAVLMGLEMEGLIDALPGLRYARRG
ncbi:MAG: DNA-processing protein DprA [Clostridia bacterium]|nr:DNA-processing protein DprA [Clostridia bacterium]